MKDSERLSRLLLELQMDAEALGKSIGKKGGDIIRNVIKGRNGISPKLAAAIAQTHNVSYKWLMSGEGEIFLPNNKVMKGMEEKEIIEDLELSKEQIILHQRELIVQQRELINKLLEQIRLLQSGL